MCNHKKYTENCYDCDHRYLNIKNYSYSRPIEFVSKPRNGMYFGMELEVECTCSSPEIILDAIKGHITNVWEFKRDGSLRNGIEFESQPIAFSYWMQGTTNKERRETGIKDYLEWTKYLPKDCKSHDTTTCGLHVHVNRSALRSIGKINYFVNKYQTQLQILGRRNWNSYCHPNAPSYNTRGGDRHSALNLSGDETIEFRFFKGTLYGATIKASIALVAAICEIVPTFTREQLENEDCWAKLIYAIENATTKTSKAAWSAYLIPYLRKKGMLLLCV